MNQNEEQQLSLSSGDIIRSKRVINIINNLSENNSIDTMSDSEIMERRSLKLKENELKDLEKLGTISALLNNSSDDFYKNNIERNFNSFQKFKSIEIPNLNKNLLFPGLYYHKNGHLVFLLSTFNNTHLTKNIIDFYKIKIQIILELTRLTQCYVYRFYYESLSRHQYLKVKRDKHCLWAYILKVDNKTSYYRIINFDHNIISSNQEMVYTILPEIKTRKRRNSEVEDELEKSVIQTKRAKLCKDTEWKKEWVSASKLRNFMINDPLLDWLEEYRIASIYDRPDKLVCKSSSTNHINTDNEFITLIKEKGNDFESLILEDLMKKYNQNIIQVAESYQARDKEKMKLTLESMKKGIPIIYQAVLHNEDNKTYGCPDFLVRSDWINKLFGDGTIVSEEEEKMPARILGKDYHYVVLDIKCSTLHLNSDGLTLRNQGSMPAYKAQLLIYNLALGNLQGYFPNKAYICGKKWHYTTKGKNYEGYNCYEKLGIIDYAGVDSKYFEKIDEALEWIRKVRNEGHTWSLLPQPSVRELYPNMCNEMDGSWRKLKSDLAEKLNEITLVLMCGPKNRNNAFDNGVRSWTDNDCNSNTLGISGKVIPGLVDKILEINRSSSNRVKVLPNKIENNYKNWQTKPKLEFFIDFETLTSLFTPPSIGTSEDVGFDTQNYIFMIGLGWENPDTNQWEYKDFTVNKVTKEEEEKIIDDMWKCVKDLSQKYDVTSLPNFYHWSHAEPTCYSKALRRHNYKWGSINFCDLLKVFRDEPVVVKGSLKFGLKGIAKAMYDNGLINTIWDSENPCSNGLTAMVLAWKAYQKNKMSNIHNNPVIQDIIKYNIIDCKVLWEIINYLRQNHI